ncbi:HAMP domain-containing histidine kinase [Blautia schinkii]|nr:HAMP domain-containing histidine kinase [Blautia schinkii]
MIKYIKQKLSIKIFVVTTLLLMGIAAATYGFVALFMPLTYSESLNRSLEKEAEKLAESLSGYKLDNAYTLLSNFGEVYQSGLILIDSKGDLIYDNNWISYFDGLDVVNDMGDNSAESEDGPWLGQSDDTFLHEGDVSKSEDEEEDEDIATEQHSVAETIGNVMDTVTEIRTETTVEAVESGSAESTVEDLEQKAMGRFPVTFSGSDEEYTLFVFGSTEQVNQAVAALKRVLPWLLLTIFVVSVLVSLFYSRYLTRPVVRLSRLSQRMADLDFEVRSQEQREDEIGILSRSLDTLSDNLDTALTELKTANARLKSDMDQEREQERRRMEFFSAASHELKTPVTILKGQVEGMIQGVGSYKDRDHYLNRAREVTLTLESMVQEILTISRMESRNFSIRPRETDLAELIRIQLADLNELFEKKQMDMEINLPDKLIWTADPDMMTTVIRNLLVNAVRYSPERARISVSMQPEKAAVAIRVENSGVWIPEENLPQIFDAFYRVDSSRNRKSGGSGLGLYIVREILEQHHAVYTMENTASGVQFTCRLPADVSMITQEHIPIPQNEIPLISTKTT